MAFVDSDHGSMGSYSFGMGPNEFADSKYGSIGSHSIGVRSSHDKAQSGAGSSSIEMGPQEFADSSPGSLGSHSMAVGPEQELPNVGLESTINGEGEESHKTTFDKTAKRSCGDKTSFLSDRLH